MAKRKINTSFAIRIATEAGELRKGLNQVQGQLKGFENNVMRMGRNVAGIMGIAFGTEQLLSFGKELVLLGGKAQGVRNAFNKLNSPGLLNRLRQATQGTLSDLELMQAAVKFNNFNLPLNQMGDLLQFVQLRAQQTGDSIDYLTDSLVEGLSKESKLRIDNLGISMAELNKELEKGISFTEAVANIARRELTEAGGVMDNAATSAARMAATWENLKTSFGEAIAPVASSFFDALAKSIQGINDVLTSDFMSKWQKFTVLLTAWAAPSATAKRIGNIAINNAEEINKLVNENTEETDDNSASLNENTKEVDKNSEAWRRYIEAHEQFSRELAANEYIKKATEDLKIQQTEIDKTIEGLLKAKQKIGPVDGVDLLAGGEPGEESSGDSKYNELKKRQEALNDLATAWAGLGDVFEYTLQSEKNLLDSFLGYFEAWVKSMIIQLAALAAASAVVSALFPGAGGFTKVFSAFGGDKFTGLFGGGFASGGSTDSPFFMAGEAGRELIFNNGTSKVFSNAQTERLLSGNNGGTVEFRIHKDYLRGILNKDSKEFKKF